MPAPLALAPIGVLAIVHPDGEPAVARAAAAIGVPMIRRTAATTSMEDVAAAIGDGPRWYQLLLAEGAASSRRQLPRAGGRSRLRRARASRSTRDMLGWRPRDLDNAYLPFLTGSATSNYLADPVFRARAGRSRSTTRPDAAVLHWAGSSATRR